MPPLNERISKYIIKFPDKKLLIHHGKMTFTFHNAKIMQCIWFAIKTKLQREPKGARQMDGPRIMNPETGHARVMVKHPSEMKLMERIMSKFTRHGGEVNPNKKPPRGKAIRWTPERGYHHVSMAEEHSTFNRWIKSENIKTKGDNS